MPGTTFDLMLERIRYEGAYATRQRAEETLHAVLTVLGQQLIGDERVDLAACLPVEAALTLTAQLPTLEPCNGWGFVSNLAALTGGSPATARWDAGAVLATVAELAGTNLLDRILAQLPPGYALLFGRAELIQAA
ncbi:DUF2267 domain-containing protein [Streptomyces sp. RKAG293]|uniref:DUF2267 domain-containing protein n=1 Tax=Streptomyces sp. RKAG293 TaxID=2893403 RepID=UPI002033E84B|nr:DUF2267 domain-containing protein [Streptomyces sp. RKAG293]MCM2422686.1 DUF2267 domain-containing protein [Streptomyces sp. RKAG293]